MDIIISSFNAVVPLFVVIAVGYLLRHLGILDETLAVRINRLCFSILIPCVLFRTTYSATFPASAFMAAIYSSVAFIVLTPVLCWVTGKFFNGRKTVATIANGVLRPNTTLLGIPLMTNLFGEDNLVCMTLIITFLVPILNMLSTVVLTLYSDDRKEKLTLWMLIKNVFKNPLIVGAILGILFNLLKVPLPTIVTKPLKDLAGTATPLAMLAMGARFNFKSFTGNRRAIVYSSLMRLAIVPAAVVGGAIALGMRNEELCALFIAAATPTAVASVSMADAMGFDGELAGEILIATSALSCLTLFLGICALRMTGLVG